MSDWNYTIGLKRDRADLIRGLILILSLVLIINPSKAIASYSGVVIAVDLAHGENPNGLTDITYNNETLAEGMLKVLKR